MSPTNDSIARKGIDENFSITPTRVKGVAPYLGCTNADIRALRKRSFQHLGQSIKTGLPLILVDLAVVLLCVTVASAIAMLIVPETAYFSWSRQLVAIAPIAMFMYSLFGLYPGAALNPVHEFRQLVIALSTSFSILLLANVALGEKLNQYELYLLVFGWFLACIFAPIFRLLARSILARQNWWGQPTLIIGGGSFGAEVYQSLLEHRTLGLRPLGIVDHSDVFWNDLGSASGAYLGPIGELSTIARDKEVFWGIVAVSDISSADLRSVVETCSVNMPNLTVIPDLHGLPSLWNRTFDCAGKPGIHLTERLLMPIPRMVKRAMDIAFVTIGGLMLLPVFCVIAMWIKLRSPGPVFYGHQRIGVNGRVFKAWKFRTMVANADLVLDEYLEKNPEYRKEWEEDQKLKNDPRVIPGIGNILRKFSIDEFPQLWNVFKGEMSLVGPRPIVTSEIVKYGEEFSLYLKVVPGITGLWQVSGRNNTTYGERVEYDSYYVRNWSPWLDVYILARTVRTVIMREGAY